MSKIIEYSEYLVNWLRTEVIKAKCQGVIVGLSGGVDSAVVSTLAVRAFPNNALGVFMPIGNMGQDLVDAQAVAQVNGIKTVLIDLTSTFEEAKKAMAVKSRLAIANIKPRLRMSALYALAQEHNYLVLGTDNAAEWFLGYFTKYGDGGVDLLPIVHLLKGEVKQMAKEMGLPEVIYTKAPTAALWDGQTDEDELGYSYAEVDLFLQNKKNQVKPEVCQKIENQIARTEHKRNSLPTPMKFERK